MLAVTVPGDPGGTLIFIWMVSQGNSCEFGHYDFGYSLVRSPRIYSRAVHDEQNDLLATMMHDNPDQAREILNNQSIKEYLEEKVQEAITDPENYLTDNVEESVPLVTDPDDATKATIHYISCVSMGQNHDELETQIKQSKLLDAEQQKLLLDIIANWKTNQLKTVENFNQTQLDSFEDQMKQAENLLINEATAPKYYNHIISKQLK